MTDVPNMVPIIEKYYASDFFANDGRDIPALPDPLPNMNTPYK